MRNFVTIAAITLLFSGQALAADVSTPEQISEGRKLSINLCAACHIVAVDQPDLPVLKITPPFFFEIANDPKTTPDSIRKFLEKTHWDFKSRPVTMPAPELDKAQQDAIIAYIMSLKR